ncbi:cysteine synthase 2 [Uncinocarpus reesii 1704]|uniref:cysteine synthase n=1 Tax=Uncinocarpus reesii (strain UAMH 1704) TaxID=336963 RepID=C4JIL4_UNCRE|nr:cysteine synthase 2 [Uncinocarpus reesii 1704]EEP76702.1 cysteine synthase 2 [Uncinocarpus reesii 1704]
MSNYPHFYIPAAAFLAGAILAIHLKAVYHHVSGCQDPVKDNKEHESGKISGSSLTRQPPPIADGIEGCIGNTPLLRIKSLSEATGCEILAKAEFLNGAGGSPKDRVALNMIQMAERQGLLIPYSGDAIYEGTVGSTGISLATLARAKGYLAHICMPSDQSVEKSDLLSKLGAVVDRVPPAPIVETNHFVNRARNLATAFCPVREVAASSLMVPTGSNAFDYDGAALPDTSKRGIFTDQFENPANWQAHFQSTGPEIFAQCEGKLDAFVSGAGTGGTISGVALYLKPRLPTMSVVLADPQGSGLFNRIHFGVMFNTKEREGTRRRRQVDTIVEGIGINRITANFEAGRELIDDAVKVTDAQAIAMAKWLVEKDGFAAVKTALKLGPGHRIVTILCDSGTRHLSKFWEHAGSVGNAVDTKFTDVLTASSATNDHSTSNYGENN